MLYLFFSRLVLKTNFVKNSPVDFRVIFCPPHFPGHCTWGFLDLLFSIISLYRSQLYSYLSTQFNGYLILEITSELTASTIYDTIVP